MSDKLLRWSLEKVFSSSPTPRRKNRAMVIEKKLAGPLLSAVKDRDGCVNARSFTSSRTEILKRSAVRSLQCLRVF